ncbi:putative RNA-directed DNA polymerase [Helianthus debilis subsp. tardiflorus]
MAPKRGFYFYPIFLIVSLSALFFFSLYRSSSLSLSSSPPIPQFPLTITNFNNIPNPNFQISPKFSFTIKVLTYDRLRSLSRCLRSLSAAHYDNDKVNIHIFIDHFKILDQKDQKDQDSEYLDKKLNESREILDFVDGFEWKFGEKMVHYRTGNVGLQAQWLEAWWPVSDDEFAFIVEDDIELSPLYYRFLKSLIIGYYYNASNYSPWIYGASLQRPRFVPGKHGNKINIDKETKVFLYQLVGTWGQLLFPKPWKEFRLWYDTHKTKGVKPILDGMTFAIQDMGQLSYFLGIEVVRSGSDIILSQQKYINELLARANMSKAQPVPSPCTTGVSLSLGDSSPFDDPVKYRQMVGALQYVTLSRPDITYAVNKVCQFMHSPTGNHWSAVKRILRYLHGTSNHGLLISSSSSSILHAYTDAHNLTAFSDSDWAGCPDDRRSTGGYAIYLGSNLISWSARKQRTVSRSSTEAEYKALANTVAELTWLETLMTELRVPMRMAPILWCDNLGATYLSANPVFHARTKHVEVDFHFVREKVAQRKLSVQFISTHDQIADVFTKPLPSDRFLLLKSKLKVTTGWYKKMGDRIWTPWFIKFIHARGYFNIYTNFLNESALSVSHRDTGVNYGKTAGPDSNLIQESSRESNVFKLEPLRNLKWYDFCFREVIPDRIVTNIDELEPVLKSVQKANALVVVSVDQMSKMLTRNLLCHFARLNVWNYIFVGPDSEFLLDLARRGHPVVNVDAFFDKLKEYKSRKLSKENIVKALVVKKALEMKYDTWVLDHDMVPVKADFFLDSVKRNPTVDFYVGNRLGLLFARSTGSGIWNNRFVNEIAQTADPTMSKDGGGFGFIAGKLLERKGVKLERFDEGLGFSVEINAGDDNGIVLKNDTKVVFWSSDAGSGLVQNRLESLGLWIIDSESHCKAVICHPS